MDSSKRLNLFVKRADELRNSRAVQKGLRTRTVFKYEKATGAKIESEKPDHEELLAALVTWRKFVLKKRPEINLESVLKLCQRCITKDDYRERISEAREALKKVRTRPFVALEVNGKSLTPEETADIWINASMFHEDEQKTADFEHMSRDPFAAILFERAFLDYVVDTTQIILFTAEIVRAALDEGAIDLGKASVTK